MFNYIKNVKEFFSPEKEPNNMSSSSSSSSSANENLSSLQRDYFGSDDDNDETNIGQPTVRMGSKKTGNKWIKKSHATANETDSSNTEDEVEEEEEEEEEVKEDPDEESDEEGMNDEDADEDEDEEDDVDMDRAAFKQCMKDFATAQGVTQRNALYRMMVFLYFGKHDDVRNDQLHLEPVIIDLSVSADSPPTPSWISSGVHSDLMGANADTFLQVVSKSNR